MPLSSLLSIGHSVVLNFSANSSQGRTSQIIGYNDHSPAALNDARHVGHSHQLPLLHSASSSTYGSPESSLSSSPTNHSNNLTTAPMVDVPTLRKPATDDVLMSLQTKLGSEGRQEVSAARSLHASNASFRRSREPAMHGAAHCSCFNQATELMSFSTLLWSRFQCSHDSVVSSSVSSLLSPHLLPQSSSSPGRGILEFKQKFSATFLKQVVFSLLKGRPVVVHAHLHNERYLDKSSSQQLTDSLIAPFDALLKPYPCLCPVAISSCQHRQAKIGSRPILSVLGPLLHPRCARVLCRGKFQDV